MPHLSAFAVGLTTVTVTISGAPSTVANCTIAFNGLQVRPRAAPGFGNPTESGTATVSRPRETMAPYSVPGSVAALVLIQQPSANSPGGAVWAQQPSVLARDQFSNNVPNVPVLLAIRVLRPVRR